MRVIRADTGLIAYCGLYCGSCRKYLREKCDGCIKYEKATWCKVMICCIEYSYNNCADCRIVEELKDCKNFNTIFSKLFSFIFRSDRFACIASIQEKGYSEYAKEMADKKMMTIKRCHKG